MFNSYQTTMNPTVKKDFVAYMSKNLFQKQSKITTDDFLKKYVFSGKLKKQKKENISENIDSNLVKIRRWK